MGRQLSLIKLLCLPAVLKVPITELMITTGENIQTYPTDNEVYYKKTNSVTNTRGLCDFHNLYVKRKLILGVSSLIGKPQRTLIDYAVGKGGDLPKWIDAKLSFVFGVDVKKDNIHNQLDGACSRYLNEKKTFIDPRASKSIS
jgi:hypothetical protein